MRLFRRRKWTVDILEPEPPVLANPDDIPLPQPPRLTLEQQARILDWTGEAIRSGRLTTDQAEGIAKAIGPVGGDAA